MSNTLIAAIEAGGTKINISVGYAVDEPLMATRIPTQTPSDTLPACVDFLQTAQNKLGAIKALGIASFGPVDIDKQSASYGTILNSPKLAWCDQNILEAFKVFDCPIALDTDVNAAAYAEHQRLEKSNCNSVYITVGTGVGVGVVINGATLTGELHPELGHCYSERLAIEPKGVCIRHGDCVEGLISGPALKQRWKILPEEAESDHIMWESVGFHLARLCYTATLAYSPNNIILGGGVLQNTFIIPMVHKYFAHLAGGYLPAKAVPQNLDSFIKASSYSTGAGLAGAFLLARENINE
ncbi:ROK family protein [Saccharophagus degradans]|uniref:ROK family protein n=1 Tax=Saccharophagus degradans TaxID=86304 RepID=UPI001C082B71|nr:ROK family protein [Saccharophagus degradans]MBU2986548.1 ROK family protein [Saccharophagus degradans]